MDLNWQFGSPLCFTCGEIFKDIRQYKKHRCDVTVIDPTLTKKQIDKHEAEPDDVDGTMVKVDGLVCEDCGAIVNDAKQYKQHIIDHHLDPSAKSNRVTTEDSAKAWSSGRNAETRARSTPYLAMIECTHCREQFEHKSDLLKHLADMHNKRLLYECPKCGTMFDKRVLLLHHLDGHMAAKDVLNEDRIGSGRLEDHSPRYQCRVCGKVFLYQKHCRQHIAIHNAELKLLKDPSPQYQCRICGMQFVYASHYRRHNATHTKDPYFTCDICGEKFETQGKLIMHKASHTWKEQFPCPICGKICPYRSYLDRHVKTHSSEASNCPSAQTSSKCPTCLKVFTIPSMLEKHIRLEHSTNHITCPLCDKRFLYHSEVERHLAAHLKYREYDCPICKCVFSYRSSLIQHLQQHTGEVPGKKPSRYDCKFCGQLYGSESTRERHIIKFHLT